MEVKTKTITLGFFPYHVVTVYGGGFDEMVRAAVEHEPSLRPDFFTDSGGVSVATTYEDPSYKSNICIVWYKEGAFKRGVVPLVSAVTHEATHIVEAMRRHVGANRLEEETYAYLLDYIVSETLKEAELRTSDWASSQEQDQPRMFLVPKGRVRQLLEEGIPVYSENMCRISRVDLRRLNPYLSEGGVWHPHAYTLMKVS